MHLSELNKIEQYNSITSSIQTFVEYSRSMDGKVDEKSMEKKAKTKTIIIDGYLIHNTIIPVAF